MILHKKKPLNLLKNGRPALLTPKEDEHLWQNWQYQLTKLSKKSVHFFAYQSGHYIQKEQPRLVINAIYTIIQPTQKNHHQFTTRKLARSKID